MLEPRGEGSKPEAVVVPRVECCEAGGNRGAPPIPLPPDRLPVTVAADSSVKDSCLWQHEGWSGRRTSLQSVSVCQRVNVTGRGARRGRGGVSASWSELIGANVRLQDERWRLSVETLNAVSVIITCTD